MTQQIIQEEKMSPTYQEADQDPVPKCITFVRSYCYVLPGFTSCFKSKEPLSFDSPAKTDLTLNATVGKSLRDLRSSPVLSFKYLKLLSLSFFHAHSYSFLLSLLLPFSHYYSLYKLWSPFSSYSSPLALYTRLQSHPCASLIPISALL